MLQIKLTLLLLNQMLGYFQKFAKLLSDVLKNNVFVTV